MLIALLSSIYVVVVLLGVFVLVPWLIVENSTHDKMSIQDITGY